MLGNHGHRDRKGCKAVGTQHDPSPASAHEQGQSLNNGWESRRIVRPREHYHCPDGPRGQAHGFPVRIEGGEHRGVWLSLSIMHFVRLYKTVTMVQKMSLLTQPMPHMYCSDTKGCL